ncbi:MAG: trimethylamine methyltransferase family protein [Rhodospirillales bacterium]|nr:trimethylamine methyltransferase family protein [Rhodospirillales bacterium]
MPRRSSNRRNKPDAFSIPQIPFQHVENPYPPLEILNAEQVSSIHDTSMKVLEKVGMRIDDPQTRELLENAGCKVNHDTTQVLFDRGFIEQQVAKAPSTVKVRARNDERSLTFGGNRINFMSVAGPAFLTDSDKGRRPGTFAELQDALRILQSLNVAHGANGGAFASMDLHPETRHLDTLNACFTLTDKVAPVSLMGRTRAQDAIDMACIMFQTDYEGLRKRPALYGNINTNSPLVLDREMAQGAMTFAEHGQAVIVTPFTLSGAMSPVTIPGALVQQNAEALAGISFIQTVNPGNPVMYGSFTSNVDMKSGSPAFGTPEYVKATLASGQLARHYGLPIRASAPNASNSVDAQAAYETQMSLWACVMGHINLVNHSFGWLEGGLCCSFDKMILDAEMVQMMVENLKPLEINEDTLGLSAIEEVGSGGHFFGAAHTMERYNNAFYSPILSDWQNFENWSDSGAQSATERATKIWKHLLEVYEAPPVAPSISKALDTFIERRKIEILGA